MDKFFTAITESWFWQYVLSHFGWVDWVLVGFVVVGIFLGLKHGLGQEFPRLLETFLALYVTFEYYPFFADWLVRSTPWPESYARPVTFALLGFLSWLTLRLLFEIIGKLIHLEVASPFQWLGGTVVGGIRYFLFFSLISYLLVLFPLDFIQRSYQVQSWSGGTLTQVPVKIYDWMKALWQKRAAV